MHDLTERSGSVLRYKGSDGRLQVSLRRLDQTQSIDTVPVHSFDRVDELAPGEAVEIDIDLLPIGLAFHPGEQLRFLISGRNLLGQIFPGNRDDNPVNRGQHLIHTGGVHSSYLQLPVQAQ